MCWHKYHNCSVYPDVHSVCDSLKTVLQSPDSHKDHKDTLLLGASS